MHQLLKQSPEKLASKFRYKMINRDGEEMFVSVLALAVNVGDYSMVDSILAHLKGINIEEGIEAKSKEQTDHYVLSIRRRSPL